MIAIAIRDLYFARWGEPSKKAQFRVAELEVEVYKWDAEATSEGVALYATIGSSTYPAAGSEPRHRAEYFLGLLPPRDAVASPLAALALYSVREGVAVGHGDTVRADGPLWPGTDMHRFLVLRPLGEIIAPLELPDGVHVEFMQAIPIFESELAYKARHGANELLEHWQDSRVAFWDPCRVPEPAGAS
jgi:Suppressor of fused protein (SUFU)